MSNNAAGQIVSEKFEVKLVLEDPKLINVDTVRFTLSVLGPDNEPVFSAPGCRVWRGSVHMPARLSKKMWIPTVIISDNVRKFLTTMVQEWRDSFPTVTFPKDEAPNEEIAK